MSEILNLGLSDDELLGILVSDHGKSPTSEKKSKKKRSKKHEKQLERT
jgi:hypothetical protein